MVFERSFRLKLSGELYDFSDFDYSSGLPWPQYGAYGRTIVEKDAQKQTLRAWVGDRRPNFEGQPQEASDETVTLSGTEKPPLPKPVHPGKEPTQEEMRKLLLARDYVKILLIEAMTGKKVRLLPDGTMDLVEPEGCSGEPGEDPAAEVLVPGDLVVVP